MKLLKVIGDRIAVQEDTGPKKKGNLFVPESSLSSRAMGTVVAISDTVTSIQVGDKVLFSKAVHDSLEHDGNPIKLVSINNVYAIVE
jgi:co-chaperonin GroES (HSP10)